jgi:hypothetical protein
MIAEDAHPELIQVKNNERKKGKFYFALYFNAQA